MTARRISFLSILLLTASCAGWRDMRPSEWREPAEVDPWTEMIVGVGNSLAERYTTNR